jgi:hypothetical protein
VSISHCIQSSSDFDTLINQLEQTVDLSKEVTRTDQSKNLIVGSKLRVVAAKLNPLWTVCLDRFPMRDDAKTLTRLISY